MPALSYFLTDGSSAIFSCYLHFFFAFSLHTFFFFLLCTHGLDFRIVYHQPSISPVTCFTASLRAAHNTPCFTSTVIVQYLNEYVVHVYVERAP
jgi:hypothetical protein